MVDRRNAPQRKCHHYLPRAGPFVDDGQQLKANNLPIGTGSGNGKGKGKGKTRGGWLDRWAFDRDDSDDDEVIEI